MRPKAEGQSPFLLRLLEREGLRMPRRMRCRYCRKAAGLEEFTTVSVKWDGEASYARNMCLACAHSFAAFIAGLYSEAEGRPEVYIRTA